MSSVLLQVFMLSADEILNIDTLSELLASGHSRVPVHVPGNRCTPLQLETYVCQTGTQLLDE